jgi:hypothetical protein
MTLIARGYLSADILGMENLLCMTGMVFGRKNASSCNPSWSVPEIQYNAYAEAASESRQALPVTA